MSVRVLLAVLACIAVVSVARADVPIANDLADAGRPTQEDPVACLVTGPYPGSPGLHSNLVFVWRSVPAAGSATYSAALATAKLSHVMPLGAIPAPAGWSWTFELQVRATQGDGTMGGFVVVGMARSAPPNAKYGLASVRGWVHDSLSVVWDTPQLVQVPTASGSTIYLDQIGLDSHRGSNFVALTHPTNFTSATPALWLRTSTDGGGTWSAPAPVGNDSTSGSTARVLCGARPGEAWVFEEDYDPASQTNSWISRRLLPGGGFDTPEVLLSGLWSEGANGPHGSWDSPPAVEVVRDSTSPNFEQRFLAFPQGLDSSPSLAWWDVAAKPASPEVEPNGTAASTVWVLGLFGQTLRGTISAASDTDCVAVDLAEGQWAEALPDSATAGAFLKVEWLGTDGISVMRNTYAGYGPMGFVAPVAGRYWLRLSCTTANVGYRVRTWGNSIFSNIYKIAPDSPADPGIARWMSQGQYDASPGQWWSTAPNTPWDQYGIAGIERSAVALAQNSDGYLYATWTDWGAVPGRDVARQMLSRTNTFANYWDPPVVVSSANSDWSVANLAPAGIVAAFTLSQHPVIAQDGHRMCVTWVDGRSGNADVFAETIDRTYAIAPGPTPYRAEGTSVHPGDVVNVPLVITNHDSYFGWTLQLSGTVNRGWSMAGPPQTVSVPPGALLPASFTFTIPDTAAAGPISVSVTSMQNGADQTSGLALSVPVNLTITPTAGVVPGEHRLALAPPSPNPAASRTALAFSLATAGHARLQVFSVDGRLVRTLADGEFAASTHSAQWAGETDAGGTARAGAYFVRLQVAGRTLTQRLAWMP